MEEFLRLLSEEGCEGLEFSPSMIWKEPVSAPLTEIKAFGRLVKSFGLEFSSMHSLTYPHPDMNFFEPEKRRKLISCIASLARLASELKVPVMVFGSGKARMMAGRPREECNRIIADSFREMAESIEPLGVTLLIEPLSKIETDSINNTKEAVELINKVGHKAFALHIDLKSTFAEKEDQGEIWSKYAGYIKHCHVADPGLKPPSADCAGHYDAAKAIKRSGYDRYISLEIGRVSGPETLKEALDFVKKVYL